jgi:hypothetical protein
MFKKTLFLPRAARILLPNAQLKTLSFFTDFRREFKTLVKPRSKKTKTGWVLSSEGSPSTARSGRSWSWATIASTSQAPFLMSASQPEYTIDSLFSISASDLR